LTFFVTFLCQDKKVENNFSNNIFFSVLFLLKEKVPKSSSTADNTTPPCTLPD